MVKRQIINDLGLFSPKQVSANRAKRLQNLAFIIEWNPKNQDKTIAYSLLPTPTIRLFQQTLIGYYFAQGMGSTGSKEDVSL
jgi:hypothetical protein